MRGLIPLNEVQKIAHECVLNQVCADLSFMPISYRPEESTILLLDALDSEDKAVCLPYCHKLL
jgi:hypothetical protein